MEAHPLFLCFVLAVFGSAFCVNDGPDPPLIGAPGAMVRLSESDPGVLRAVKFAEERYNMGSNGMHVRRVSRVISASKQVGYFSQLWATFVYDCSQFQDIAYCLLFTAPQHLLLINVLLFGWWLVVVTKCRT